MNRATLTRRPVAWLLLASATVSAQQPPPAITPNTGDEAAAQTLNSTEQGRTPMPDSFRSRRERIKEERRHAFEETAINWQLRTYDFDSVNANDSRSAAWALGGSLGFETGLFRDWVSFGATGYTSQPLYAPSGEGGTKLLTNEQNGYTVLGEAFAQFRINDELGLTAGRRGYDTPYLSRNDTRMTPQTFEGVALQGDAGDSGTDDEAGQVRYGGGYIDKEKQVNSDDFVSMARVAGAAVDQGVWVAGANYKSHTWSFGAVEYFSPDIINIAYTEAGYAIWLGEAGKINLAAQYTSQHSVGAELLTGGYFSANQVGMKAEIATGPTLLTTAYTFTGRGSEMRSPWSGYPGYTSVQIEDFDGAGENAFMLRAACNITPLPGMSAYALWVRGTMPDSPTDVPRDEYDLNLQWIPSTGSMAGLMFRVRYAWVTQADDGHQSQLRLMLFYTPPAKK